MIRVLLADDQAMVRAGFRLILDGENDLEVVAEAADGVDALAAARRLRPDVCLVDIRMPGLDGLELTRRLAGPDVTDPLPVVVVTTFDLDDYVTDALDGGASGFLLKHADPALLIAAIRAAHRGDALISPQVTLRLLRRLRPTDRTRRPKLDVLTDRERDVVHAVARGLSNTEIGRELHLSLSTVKTHLAGAQTKLAARNRVDLAVWAWRQGLLEP